jgi:hypothetical protein
MYTAQSMYGVQPQIPGATAGVSAPTMHSALSPDDITSWRALVDIHNPLVIFGLVLALTLGAAGISGSAKAGPVKFSGSLGDTD